jgi:hypothetical protein
MSRRHRRTQIGGQFAPRLIEMLESPAYRALSLSAHRVLARIEIELAHHGGTLNGRLPVTYDDFEKYGIHRHSISAAIREAVALGFVEVTEQGRAGNAEWRSPSLFRLTYRAADGLPSNDGCSHEWRRIGDPSEAERIAKMARKAKPEKAKVQWRKMPISSGGNRHRKHLIHSVETTTTGHSTETATTIDISGGISLVPPRQKTNPTKPNAVSAKPEPAPNSTISAGR